MKIQILLGWILLATACGLVAQPVLNRCGLVPTEGDYYSGVVVTCDTNGIVLGNTGANMTWNYAGLTTLSSAAKYIQFYDASNTANAAAFPYANVATATGFHYEYYAYQWNEILYYGSYDNSLNCDSFFDPVTQIHCPMAFNSSFTDDYAISDCQNTTLNGNRKVTYDGYGTLIMPNGTFQDVVRLYTVDTIYPLNFYVETYTWIESATFLGRLTVSISGQLGLPPAVVEASYFDIFFASVDAADGISPAGISLSPNPVNDQLDVKVPENQHGASLKVITIAGQKVMDLPLSGERTHLELPALPAGMYLYQIIDHKGNVLQAGKLAKQ